MVGLCSATFKRECPGFGFSGMLSRKNFRQATRSTTASLYDLLTNWRAVIQPCNTNVVNCRRYLVASRKVLLWAYENHCDDGGIVVSEERWDRRDIFVVIRGHIR
jgi:hypothetical protein